MEIQQLLSKYMLEISKVDDENKLYNALVGILKRILDFQVLNVLKENEVIYTEPLEVTIDKEHYMNILIGYKKGSNQHSCLSKMFTSV